MARNTAPRKQIKEGKAALKEVMQLGLASIAVDLIDKVMRSARNSTPATILNSIKNVQLSGVSAYKNDLLTSMAIISNEALKQARKEVPRAAKIKLSETNYFDESIKFAQKKGTLDTVLFNSLPINMRKALKITADLLVDTQISDLEKSIFFQFNSSAKATDSMKQLEFEIKGAAEDFIEGNSISVGASSTAAGLVNDSRNAFFMDDDVLEEIDAFIFRNDIPITNICASLVGTVFAKDDPDMFKYTGPLHYNCDSWMEPILRGDLGNRKIEKLQSKYDDDIQFSECGCMHH